MADGDNLEVGFGEERATLGLGEPTPDPVRFPHPNREVEAVVAHATLRADSLRVRLPRLAIVSALRRRRWKEQRRFGTSARCFQVPGLVNKTECHAYSVPEHPLSARKVSGRYRGDKQKFSRARLSVGYSYCRPERSR
jgi:hypothetical protein